MLAALPAAVLLTGVLYMETMTHLEGSPRDFWFNLEWAAETLTTSDYGADTHWQNPLMVAFVIIAQFLGLFLVFLLFPVYVIPFFEERFETRLPSTLPAIYPDLVHFPQNHAYLEQHQSSMSKTTNSVSSQSSPTAAITTTPRFC